MTAYPMTDIAYDVDEIRRDFPILSRPVHGRKLVYLDNAASAQKPKQVMDTIAEFVTTEYSNVHRGVHYLSATATERYEEARGRVRRFLKRARRAHAVRLFVVRAPAVELITSIVEVHILHFVRPLGRKGAFFRAGKPPDHDFE